MKPRSHLTNINGKKIIVVGEGGVGKTTLLHRSIDDEFLDSTEMTIGSDFFVKKGDNSNEGQEKQPYMLIWDFAGQERFRFILKDYLRGTKGVILCFDLTKSRTLRKLYGWIDLLKEGGIWGNQNGSIWGNEVKFFLVGTKNDLAPNNPDAISKKMIKKFMSENNIKQFFKTSALDSSGVDELFTHINKYMFY